MWEAWGLVGGNGHPEAYIRFAEPAVRRGLAEILHRCQALDRQAAEDLERALAR
jgi:hypothetical protein